MVVSPYQLETRSRIAAPKQGRLSTTLMIRSAVLETRGARTGQSRRNAVIYFHDGERVIIVASNAGAPRHPSWFHNIRSHPEVTLGGVRMLATVVPGDDDERRLAALGDRVFPAFAFYRREAARHGRAVPIVELTKSPCSPVVHSARCL